MTTVPGASDTQPQPPAVYIFPASLGQRRLWSNDQRNPGRSLYNVAVVVRLLGAWDLDNFHRSLREVASRHESLRTHFVAANGEPQQVISTHLDFEVPLIDLTGVLDDRREEEARKLVQEEVDTPFNLQSPPLWRVKLLRLREQDHVLVVVMHHIISDGWSAGVMMGEISALYTAFVAGRPSPLPELPIQYADFSEWERGFLQGTAAQQQLHYWTNRLSGAPAVNLPYDRPKTGPPPGKGGAHVLRVEQDVVEGLKQLSRQQNATLYMTLMAAYQTLLYRYSGQYDIAVGSNIARRTKAELEGVIGYFANNIIIRTKPSGEWSFCEMLDHVREATLDAYENQDVPLDRVVQELAAERDPKRPLIFHLTLTLQNFPQPEARMAALEVRPFAIDIAPAKHDISVFVRGAGGALCFDVLYNMDLFDPETITGIFEHYAFLLKGIVANPEQKLAKLPLSRNWTEGEWESI